MSRMVDLSIYFKPVSEEYVQNFLEGELGAEILKHDSSGFPELSANGLALIYIPEYRRSLEGINGSNDNFRERLYRLKTGNNWTKKIFDLGTVLPGSTIEDTEHALAQIVSELVKIDVIPIIIGGSQDLTLACYKGFKSLEQTINICAVDSELDVGEPNEAATSSGFVSHLLMQRPCYLFNYANIGMQRSKVLAKEMDLFDKLFFDICRLGEFNADFRKAEPHLRNADILSIDFSSIKASEFDSNTYKNPNGFRADQICQIAHYAGVSDKLSCFGVFEVHPSQSDLASSLLGEIIWYFMDGVSNRVGDFPIGTKKSYKKFHVHLDDFEDDLIFYKSNRSERWWLEVSHAKSTESKYARHHLVPCDYNDYEKATENVIPNLWWKTLQKLS